MLIDFDSTNLARALDAARNVRSVIFELRGAATLTPNSAVRAVRSFEVAAADEGSADVALLCQSLLAELDGVRRACISPSSFGGSAVERIDSYMDELAERQQINQKERMAA